MSEGPGRRRRLRNRRQRHQGQCQSGSRSFRIRGFGASGHHGQPRRAERYLDALDETNSVRDGDDVDPREKRKNPAASWTAEPGGRAFYAYSTNYLIDLDVGIIVDVEATPAHRTQEVESKKKMINRLEERFGMKPDRLVGDTAYGTA